MASVARYLTGRAIGLTLLAIALVAAMVWLGLWQLGVYDSHQRADAVARLHDKPKPLDDLLGPDDAFASSEVGVPVTMSGHYDADSQLYVRGLVGAPGKYAVVTPLVTDNGSAVLVVRGSSDSIGGAQPPSGPVTVTGVLEPSTDTGSPLDDSRVTDGLDISALIASVSTDLYSGYVVATGTTPADDSLPKVSPPLPDASRWAGIRNLIYALQWWCFAAFVIFMWWRVLTDLGVEQREQAAAQQPPRLVG